MTRPYSLFKKSNGYYYVQFLLADGSRSQNKSTGTKDHKEAKSQSVDRISFFNSMSTYDFSPEEIDKMSSGIMKNHLMSRNLLLKEKFFHVLM